MVTIRMCEWLLKLEQFRLISQTRGVFYTESISIALILSMQTQLSNWARPCMLRFDKWTHEIEQNQIQLKFWQFHWLLRCRSCLAVASQLTLLLLSKLIEVRAQTSARKLSVVLSLQVLDCCVLFQLSNRLFLISPQKTTGFISLMNTVLLFITELRLYLMNTQIHRYFSQKSAVCISLQTTVFCISSQTTTVY